MKYLRIPVIEANIQLPDCVGMRKEVFYLRLEQSSHSGSLHRKECSEEEKDLQMLHHACKYPCKLQL